MTSPHLSITLPTNVIYTLCPDCVVLTRLSLTSIEDQGNKTLRAGVCILTQKYWCQRRPVIKLVTC